MANKPVRDLLAVVDRLYACDGKIGYGPKSATKAAKEMERKTGQLFDAYECKYCPRWHVGHRQ